VFRKVYREKQTRWIAPGGFCYLWRDEPTAGAPRGAPALILPSAAKCESKSPAAKRSAVEPGLVARLLLIGRGGSLVSLCSSPLGVQLFPAPCISLFSPDFRP
jgi:hypothetical protein